MLHIDIAENGLDDLVYSLSATEKQVDYSLKRSLKRTAASLRRKAGKALRTELELRNNKALKRRLKMLKLTKVGNRNEAGIWFGANDLPVSAFKGRARKTSEGATFKGHAFKGAFIGTKPNGKRTLYYRKGKKHYPIAECKLPVADQIQVFVEDNIFTDVEPIFRNHFERDLTARTTLQIGKA